VYEYITNNNRIMLNCVVVYFNTFIAKHLHFSLKPVIKAKIANQFSFKTRILVKSSVFSYITPCILVKVNGYFGAACHFCLQS
jgi:hypothetical protein